MEINFNTTYIRDSLYEYVIKDCMNSKIDSHNKRRFSGLQEIYEYTHREMLARHIFAESTKELIFKFKFQPNTERQYTYFSIEKVSKLCNSDSNKALPEIVSTAWMTTDDFKWSSLEVLPDQIKFLRNELQCQLNYNLVSYLYKPICLYSMTILGLQSKSKILQDFILNITDTQWDAIEYNTKAKILRIIKVSEATITKIDYVSKTYKKGYYVK